MSAFKKITKNVKVSNASFCFIATWKQVEELIFLMRSQFFVLAKTSPGFDLQIISFVSENVIQITSILREPAGKIGHFYYYLHYFLFEIQDGTISSIVIVFHDSNAAFIGLFTVDVTKFLICMIEETLRYDCVFLFVIPLKWNSKSWLIGCSYYLARWQVQFIIVRVLRAPNMHVTQ